MAIGSFLQALEYACKNLTSMFHMLLFTREGKEESNGDLQQQQ